MTHSELIKHNISLDTIAPLGRIGLIALATDFNSEQDLRRMYPDGVEVFTNRVLNANPVTPQNLRNMAGDISRAAGGILPGFSLDAMIYGCTSGTVANGAEKIGRKGNQVDTRGRWGRRKRYRTYGSRPRRSAD